MEENTVQLTLPFINGAYSPKLQRILEGGLNECVLALRLYAIGIVTCD